MAFLSERDVERILKAGRIAAEVKKLIPSLVVPGRPYREIAEAVENAIRERGGVPAFPCNISWGHEAAHYSPFWDDKRVVPEEGVIKIDFGVSVEGYLSDTSVSIDLSGGDNEDLIKAAQEALDRALSIVGPGVNISDVSSTIEKTIKSYNLKPISNLTGHTMEPYRLHAGISIPNVESSVKGAFRPGMLAAIEPFVTKGLGMVVDGDLVNIYSFSRPLDKRMKRRLGRLASVFEGVYMSRRGLPFSERWLMGEVKDRNVETVRSVLSMLASRRYLNSYPVLIEPSGLQVAQAEDTVLVLEKEVIVTTRRNG